MNRRTPSLVLLVLLPVLCFATGCTLYGPKKPPTLKSTTSAEQYERIYWQQVKARQWDKVNSMLAPSVIFTAADGAMVDGTRWIALLQAHPIADYSIGAVQVRPQGADMTLYYVVSVTHPGSTTPENLAVTSVWQQAASNWILIVHTETPTTVTP